MKKHVLITGGSGFLGRRLARHLKTADHHVVIAARNNGLLREASLLTNCHSIPMDVARRESVREALRQVNPDVIIHAAATKYVDVSERQPMECIDVNVVGSQNVAAEAMACGVPYVLGVSTDKASPPVRNTYGLSKAMMERLFCTLSEPQNTIASHPQTTFACVRFGNIAWSTGSVLPIWKKMMETSGVIETTAGPQMYRYMFTVDEAVNTVVTTLQHMDVVGGKVVVRPMKRVNVRQLLLRYVQLKGGQWTQGPERPGERDDEPLVGDAELPFSSDLHMKGERFCVIDFSKRSSSPLPPLVPVEASQDDIDRIINAEPK
jgi:UDP-N-acetylglucosamine 4,6-dehydratase